ncbi:MAG TPA: serine/threonine-protein kinase [Pseudacidobacterium sp.]|jgi:serine/threonine-protein kinase|nr:serine/threonine-protein kinase [Pseudacidobacterium sp.]
MALEAGQRAGDYEVLALLGTGGMGRVYKVRNIISDRVEAMKILLPDYASEPELAARFMAEIRTLAGLDHPNIAQLRTAFQFENQLVMIMEFVEGTTLEKVAGQSRIPVDQVLEYSIQVLSALSYAHSRGVTHRDIKPANIMITPHGLVKLMDFGIAKSTNDLQLTRPGTTMGSVYYMSPEQVRGGTIDARSDIYSFGITLYEMLTGRRPFQADTSFSVLNAQLNEAPTPPAQVNPLLSSELNNIVLRAMVKHPDGRFQTANEFRNAILALRGQQQQGKVAQEQGFAPMQAVPSTGGSVASGLRVAGVGSPIAAPPPSAPTPAKSRRGLWIGLGAVAAILALVAAATLLPHIFATHAGQKATAPSDMQTQPAPASSAASPQSTSPGEANPLTSATPNTAAAPAATNPSGQNASALAKNPQTTKSRQTSAVANTQTETASTPTVTPAPTGPSPAEIRETRDRFSNLEARADAAKSSVQTIRSQQQAQGFDMRGDIVAAMNRMNSSMSEANRALEQNNLQTANEYMDRAEKDLATLESFLGR